MRSGSSNTPILIGFGFLFLCFLSLVFITSGMAAPFFQESPVTPTASSSSNPTFEGNIIGNNVCFSCHGQPGMTKTLVHGDILDLYVSPEGYAASIHGSRGYACVQCHLDYMAIPHPTRNFADLRDVTLKLSEETCARCHSGEALYVLNSVHSTAQAAGRREAAVCGDCHRPHTTPPLNDPATGELTPAARLLIPQTCAKCHYAIYEVYRTSVHGAALLDENNLDVPTCIDCHGVHNITDPTTTAFRLASPQLCASCHTDPNMMDEYGLSTEVLSTYVADFHGTTVTLFEQHTPDQETNKPVCYDCHGIHDIASSVNPEKGLQVRENLLTRCRVCHPDATENFPDAWLSHYIPDPKNTPLVFYANLFYKFMIPGVLGAMGLLVVLDVGKTLSDRIKNHLQQQRERITPPPEEDISPIMPEMAGASSTHIESPAGESLFQVEPVPEPDQPLEPEGIEPTVMVESELQSEILNGHGEQTEPGEISPPDPTEPPTQAPDDEPEVTHG